MEHHSRIYLGGRWTTPATAARFQVISPFTEAPIASFPAASSEDVDLAVQAARQVFDAGPWKNMPMANRIAAFMRLRALMMAHHEDLAQAITREMGSPITAAREQQAQTPLAQIDAFTAIAAGLSLSELRGSADARAWVERRPRGVVAAILPWNAPVIALMMKLAPALLSGCCVIAKIAPEAALSGALMSNLLDRAGFPPGVISLFAADRSVSEYLALHPGVNKVSFTGSTAAGRHLAARCGALLRPITLELGGKSAAIVLEDADPAQVAASLRLGSLRNSGQICSLKTRIIVPRQRHPDMVEALAALIDSLPVGDPQDPATCIGPMVSQAQSTRVGGYIEKGLAEGATAIRGGPGRPEGVTQGWFVRPTLFTQVDPGSTIAQEEIFGPVLCVLSCEDEADAIRIANHSRYGLNGAVFSADPQRALRIARQIKSGVMEVNGHSVGFNAPIGGCKDSGLGREAGREGFEPYLETHALGLPPGFLPDSP